MKEIPVSDLVIGESYYCIDDDGTTGVLTYISPDLFCNTDGRHKSYRPDITIRKKSYNTIPVMHVKGKTVFEKIEEAQEKECIYLTDKDIMLLLLSNGLEFTSKPTCQVRTPNNYDDYDFWDIKEGREVELVW